MAIDDHKAADAPRVVEDQAHAVVHDLLPQASHDMPALSRGSSIVPNSVTAAR
ncbi:uncharacterized protein SCHCODRAFT_02608499 [Schizophyllum commune H4-8]|uniref:uncharacterized protein n=1 Tax=Schizophyllum commune (strain H4-8 / FGSC 9210) TaxID=578458 RepID=UPI002160B3B5|nr:uncharacterized protein SCHCODRAFT_02608499 [Schizophyllum commune H4-8]KAI5900657.1 hypothetical protein SCHCODRAFT_02608499 [Schizophyllum commune H4-8]